MIQHQDAFGSEPALDRRRAQVAACPLMAVKADEMLVR
jgi:hypothetical protein